jgi:hypothetical protein
VKIRIVGDEKEIIIHEIINERVELVDELITLKNISIQLSVETPFKANMNPYLAETLISNLSVNLRL